MASRFQTPTPTWSSHTTPTQVRLCKADGAPARTIDTNPVYAREEYRTGKYELVKIKAPDGFVLEGSLHILSDFQVEEHGKEFVVFCEGPFVLRH